MKILFLHMPKGADKLCKYIAGSGPKFLCYTDSNFPALIEKKSPKILNLKLKDIQVFVSVSTWTQAGRERVVTNVVRTCDPTSFLFHIWQ